MTLTGWVLCPLRKEATLTCNSHSLAGGNPRKTRVVHAFPPGRSRVQRTSLVQEPPHGCVPTRNSVTLPGFGVARRPAQGAPVVGAAGPGVQVRPLQETAPRCFSF